MTDLDGTLSVTIGKKNKKNFSVSYVDAKGKQHTGEPVQPGAVGFSEDDAVDGISVNIDKNDTGQIKLVTIPGKAQKEPPKPKDRNSTNGSGRSRNTPQTGFGSGTSYTQTAAEAQIGQATAPYNFIPQDMILPAPDAGGSYSGTIVCRLRTLRPLLISGNTAPKEQRGEDYQRKHFFTVNGKPTVPGSSLKGLLRSTVEALSLSRMRFLNDRPLFWRNIDDRTYYMPLIERVGIPPDRIHGGFLSRDGADYSLTPVGVKQVLVTTPRRAGWTRVQTGFMQNKKHDYDFAEQPAATAISVADEVIRKFFLQLTEAQKKRIRENHAILDIEHLKKGEKLPVFYIPAADGKVELLGLTRCFRVPTRYTVRQLCDKTIPYLAEDRLDFAEQLFGIVGKNRTLRGRISVTAAVFPKGTPEELHGPVVLGQPRETCIAHYLVQDSAKVRLMAKNKHRLDINTMVNYNVESRLRGRKMYWHREVEVPAPPNINKKVAAYLYPLSKGAEATFTVHLDRLALEELGAIVEALHLPKGYAHKLGMGKPLGFGSVRISITAMDVQKDADRYASLAQRCASLASTTSPVDEGLLGAAGKAFRRWVLDGLGKASAPLEEFEKLLHIRSLRHMMDFDHGNCPGNAATKTMDLDGFKPLRILPDALQVK